MRRKIMLGGLAVSLATAVSLGAALLTADYCTKWNPLSCHGPDPELMKYAR